MAEYRITYWRDIPSMVTARDAGGATAKAALSDRFQEAIDEAAMREGLTGSDAYLEQWRHGDWEPADGNAAGLASTVAERLEAQYGPDRLAELVGA
jgi:hypothetical protein